MTTQERELVKSEYGKRVDAAIANLKDLLKAARRLKKVKPETINWGNVGDASHALKLTKEMKESLGIE